MPKEKMPKEFVNAKIMSVKEFIGQVRSIVANFLRSKVSPFEMPFYILFASRIIQADIEEIPKIVENYEKSGLDRKILEEIVFIVKELNARRKLKEEILAREYGFSIRGG